MPGAAGYDRCVWRIFREWVLPLAISAGLVAIAAVLEIPPLWFYIIWMVVAVGFSTAIWILSSGSVIEIATWLIPALALSSANLLYPSTPGLLVLGFVLLLPVVGQLVAPIGRVFQRYVIRVSGWIVPLTLATPDRAASAELRRALIPDPLLRDGTFPIDDRSRLASAFRAHAERIRTVGAPDLGWTGLIRKLASAVEEHANYVDGRRRDDGEAIVMLAAAKQDFHQLLRSRSIGYRMLTHRFVLPEQEAGP